MSGFKTTVLDQDLKGGTVDVEAGVVEQADPKGGAIALDAGPADWGDELKILDGELVDDAAAGQQGALAGVAQNLLLELIEVEHMGCEYAVGKVGQ